MVNDHNTAQMPSQDYLTTLPPEIIQHISSYLLASHIPDKAHHELGYGTQRPSFSKDLLCLSSTSKILHQQTNDWAHHFLHQHRAITKYKDYKTLSAAAKQRPLKEFLQWTSKHCVFCGKKSLRSAILMNGLRCCGLCDREQWADKITKTEAIKKYKLKDHQLLPRQKLLTKYPGLPPLRYGTYFSAGVLTTMFMREDVEALAELAHGDLKGHLKKREAARQSSKKAREEKRQQKELEAYEAAEAGTSSAVNVARIGGMDVVIIDDDDDNEVVAHNDFEADDAMFNELVVID